MIIYWKMLLLMVNVVMGILTGGVISHGRGHHRIDVCLMATPCFLDFNTVKNETSEMIHVFEELFEVNITERPKKVYIETILNWSHTKVVFFEIILPLLQNTGLALAGCTVFALIANHFGRRVCLIVLLSLVIGLFIAKIIHDHAAMRILTSFTSMGAMIVIITYVSEIAPPKIRGILITLPETMTVIRFFYVSFLFKYRFYISLIILCISFILIIIFCEETPQYSILKGKSDEAFKALNTFRHGDSSIDVEIDEMIDDIEEQKKMKISELLYTFKMGIGLLIFEWFALATGFIIIGTWIYHAMYMYVEIFPEILVYIIISSRFLPLILIDLFNRKSLLIGSTTCMTILYAIFCMHYSLDVIGMPYVNWLIPVIFVCYLICYQIGIGALLWVMLAEIYPTRIKVWLLGFSLFFSHYLAGLFIIPFILIFLYISSYSEIGAVMILFVSWIISFFCLVFKNTIIETRGKSLWEIQEELYSDY